jgi:hypothetical protein
VLILLLLITSIVASFVSYLGMSGLVGLHIIVLRLGSVTLDTSAWNGTFIPINGVGARSYSIA